jgi:hypothetical protein
LVGNAFRLRDGGVSTYATPVKGVGLVDPNKVQPPPHQAKNLQKILDKSEPPAKLNCEEEVKSITLEEGEKGERYRCAYIG